MAKPRQYVVVRQICDLSTAQMFYRTKPHAAIKPVKRDLKPHREAEVNAVWETYAKAGEPFMFYHKTEGYPR